MNEDNVLKEIIDKLKGYSLNVIMIYDELVAAGSIKKEISLIERRLYKAIMYERKAYNDLSKEEVEKLLEYLNLNKDNYGDGIWRVERKLTERKRCLLTEGNIRSTYKKYSLNDVINSVIDIQVHKLVGKRIMETKPLNSMEEILHDGLKQEHLEDTYIYPSLNDFSEDLAIIYGFENIPEYDFNWIAENVKINYHELQRFLFKRLKNILDALVEKPYIISADNDHFMEDTYAYLTTVIEFEMILNLLSKEYVLKIRNEYEKNYSIKNKIIDDSIRKLIKRKMN